MGATASAVINAAKLELGKYFPKDSPYGIWYAEKVRSSVYRNAQFCAMGVSWVANKVGALDIIPLHAYTPSGVNWFKSKKRWYTKNPKRGDLVYFDFPGPPYRVSHVGIVESVNSNGTINTIEFNTSGKVGGDQRNGRTVARKTRSMESVVGFGRPAYSTASGTKPPAQKTIAQLVAEVNKGLHGSGEARKKSLGNRYNEVQAEINRQAGIKPSVKKPSATSRIADTGAINSTIIKAWQKASGTTQDGYISTPSNLIKAVQRKLNAKGYKGHNGKALTVDGLGFYQTGIKTNTIYAVQTYLRDLGFYKGTRDGILTRKNSLTIRALVKALNQGKW